MKNLAILSINQDAYSETFIKIHKTLPFNISYYYGNVIPTHLEGKGYLLKNKLYRLYISVVAKIKKKETRLFALERSLRKENIDVVLAEYGTTGAECLAIVKSLKLPLLVFFHGYDASVTSTLDLYRVKYLALFKYASCVFSVSNAMTEKLVSIGCDRKKICYNVYGPNNLFLGVKPNFENNNFVAIGRFADKKAPYYTILAFNQVVKKHPDAKLIMAGDGPLWNVCKNLILHLNLQRNVSLIGIINPQEWAKLLGNCIAFLQHSVTAATGDMEGTPVAVLEACAAGIPVISTYHAGIPDIIEHEENGLLCEEHDVDLMAVNIIRIFENRHFAQELGKNSKLKIKERFSIDQHLQIITTEIESSLKSC
ncbi:glycosyltransferase [Pedobacter arcticus]|uniref:glycosyltransferase n=1 Tax=Pedobacter arcticus TaxID=752140 RepID=UPI0002F8DC7F|nr:glycosyltransferase [Pedobacter arcticus]